MFDQKKIDAIAERDATIECFNITLTQNTLNFPLIFSGPGCLFFDESKNLKVKLYSTSTTSESIEVTSFFWSDHIGLIPEERYFELEAEDAHGKTWKNTRVLVQRGVDIYPSGSVLELILTNVRSLLQLSHSTIGASALITVNGNYRMPFNEFIDNGKGSKELAKLRLPQGTKTVEIVQKDNRLEISIVDSLHPVELNSLFYLLEGISIAIGQLLEASFIVLRNGNTYEAYIQGSVTENTYTLADAIVEITPRRETELSDFLQLYMKARPKGLNHLVNYWHRLKDISKANTEAAALVLCVNIEGMVKNYFSISTDLDETTLKEISDTRNFIKSSESNIPKTGANAILSFLGSPKKKDGISYSHRHELVQRDR
ncbi:MULTISPECIES: hypothetical protein [Pseudomonas syringae group]|uniref:Uncharacterized protein n=3 Tax=Pseudomonas syringae group genomosp. 2 TaxID=251698 RepID=A0AAX1VM75_PSEAJ|nr:MULTISPECIES: hypothetical protein [Pseudomonas syringae group]KPX54787.1 Uncharacterized protein ALO35_03121 [Pseudomonas amygdali pv. lachrymans]KPY79899.1 Uncharacterized protein ALO60_03180 [Pseudomonas amygdali pv. tabaci]MDU8629862.1 hypothetical protein [Pseudomonas syringae group sp. 243L2]QOI06676.1 hypothetical protein D5S10_24245 [Pseudomonas savastanoi]RML75098.1 hypothetical protein ALQ89_04665 [Pseudomonas amygdali pv. tabaci]